MNNVWERKNNYCNKVNWKYYIREKQGYTISIAEFDVGERKYSFVIEKSNNIFLGFDHGFGFKTIKKAKEFIDNENIIEFTNNKMKTIKSNDFLRKISLQEITNNK